MALRDNILSTALFLPSLSAAQIGGVVADMETHTPIKGVEIVVNGSYSKKVFTDYAGRFSIEGDVKELTFIRKGYESRLLRVGELRDTVELLPSYNRVEEVVIYGTLKGNSVPLQKDLKKSKVNEAVPTKPILSGDFLGWLRVFEKGHVSAKKRKERMKAIENY